MAVIGAQGARIIKNGVEAIIDVFNREDLQKSSDDTAFKLYDIGDDFGSISRYILDFHRKTDFEDNEWD